MRKIVQKKSILMLFLLACLFMVTACGGQPTAETVADTVLQSSVIYTVASEEPIAGGVAIAGNQILAVGTMEELTPYIAESTVIKDMGDQMIMPGFIEGHTHSGAAWTTSGVNVTGVESKEEIGEMVKAWAEANPDEPWIFGGGWYAANWGGEEPTKEDLDKYVSDRPVALDDFDGHNGWYNSKALELAGITKETAKELSVNGEIVVDNNGEPTGYIKEGPRELIYNLVPPLDDISYLEAAIDVWPAVGITSISEMSLNTPDGTLMTQLKQLETEGKLKVRHFVSLDMACTEEELKEGMKLYASDMLRPTAVKAFLDGVGSVGTAAMLQPYEGTDNSGEMYMTEDELAEGFIKADNLGLGGHVHACGDRAVRTGLNAYEKMIQTNGSKERRNISVEHCDTTAPEDIPRFAELGVGANLTPDFMAPTAKWSDNPYIKVYDEKVEKELWNTGSFIKSGALITFGTDSFYSTMNPLVQIYRAVERVCNDGEPKGGYMPEEKIDVKTAIRCYTINSAKSVGMEDKIGTLEAGKYADIIVLDHNILTASPQEIFDTKVVFTMMDGKVVYEK